METFLLGLAFGRACFYKALHFWAKFDLTAALKVLHVHWKKQQKRGLFTSFLVAEREALQSVLINALM